MAEKGLLKMCALCRRIIVNGKWVGEEYPEYDNLIKSDEITHGYCASCIKAELKKYNMMKKQINSL